MVKSFFIVDDEIYCPVDSSEVPGNEYYNIVNDSEIDIEARTKRKLKFYNKYLVWQAISQYGQVSEQYITFGTINKQIYLEECIKKHLVLFINKLKQDHDIIFWPDMASSHYARIVCDYLYEHKIDYVQNGEMPQPCPTKDQ